MAEFIEPPKNIPILDQRISALVNIKSTPEKKETVNLLSRHSQKYKYVKTQQRQMELLVPISDKRISPYLCQLIFFHPFTLVALLNQDWTPLSDSNISKILLTLQLYTPSNPKVPLYGKLIPALARLYFMKPNNFLIHFKARQTKTKTIMKYWSHLFSFCGLSDAEINHQINVCFDRLVAHFPTEDWELRSMDDLYSLHVLACSMNTRIFLILPRIPKSELLPTSYSLPLGPDSPNYEIYVAVKSADQFCIAFPQLQTKIVKNIKETCDGYLKTFETVNQNMAIYYNYQKKALPSIIERNSTKIESIFTFPIENHDINSPSLDFIQSKSSANFLEIHANLPSFNKDNNALLLSFLESISDEADPFKMTKRYSKSNNYLMCKNAYSICGSSDRFVLTRETKEIKMKMSQFGNAKTPSQLEDICSEIGIRYRYLGNMSVSGMNDVDVYRMLVARLPLEQRIELLPTISPNMIPLFLPQTSRTTLADCKKSAYSELLCTLSILKYCSGRVNCQRICSNCQIFEEGLLIPLRFRKRRKATKEVQMKIRRLRFVCLKCLRKKVRAKNAEWCEAYNITKEKFKMFNNLANTDNKKGGQTNQDLCDSLLPYISMYEKNIHFLHEHPIGYLRQMIDLIDNAFLTVQKILSAHDRMKDGGQAIPLVSMLGIRDSQEARIQLNDFDYEANDQPVDFLMFSQYLENQADVQYSSPQFQLVKKPDEIMNMIDQAVFDKFEEHYDYKGSTPFSVTAHVSEKMEINFSFPDNQNDIKTLRKYKYKLYPINTVSHLSLSPIAEINTNKIIVNVWLYDYDHVLILAQDDKPDDKYCNFGLYYENLRNLNLCYCEPFYEMFDINLKCMDCLITSSKHQLFLSYESVDGFNCICMTLHLKNGKMIHDIKATPDIVISHCAYAMDSTLYVALKENEGSSDVTIFAYDQLFESERESIDDLTDVAQLVGNPLYLVAIHTNGKLTQILPQFEEGDEESNGGGEEEEEEANEANSDNNEKEEEDDKEPRSDDNDENNEETNENDNMNDEGNGYFSNFNDFSPKCPIFPTTSNGKIGLACVSSPSLPFDNHQDRLNVTFNEMTCQFDSYQFSLGKLPSKREPFFNQYGVKKGESLDEKRKPKPLREIWNIHLTAAEYFPALIAYETHGSMFVVRRNMEQYRANRRNMFMPSAIASHYARTYSALSLHHIEDVIRTHLLQVNIVAFFGEMEDNQIAQFADSIFGTRLAAVSIPGVWIALRVIKKVAHVILFFRGAQNYTQHKLTASYRAANFIYNCTTKVINTIYFTQDWQNTVTSRNVLTDARLHPDVNIAFFMPPAGDHSMNTEAVAAYKDSRKIFSSFLSVPYRKSWNQKYLYDPEEEEEEEEEEEDNEEEEDHDENIEVRFKRTIQNLLNCKLNPSCYRQPFKSEDGISNVKQIIATYLTLIEFNDLPALCVVKHCNLMCIKK
ncbi:hypothetical protein TRFO_25444 [Tritrichomonas foetus]|uniref:Uncharacterized protein n=1 Tax=Tritrichomonas foetus TaxID=1144522 RepID=A0A1J4KA19_9EUKA|nr:hypothetical protein TRFO_25444 [Tritrichomonas foetus]|eukprot:OHT06494.1 hypothetical protein TRFO_25444 [Tritrichomonas foetus]